MKLCPQCESGYNDRKSTCPIHGGLLTETNDLPRGLLIRGAYRILRKLGQGSMGTVYLVEHEPAGEIITLKFLSPELSGDESFTSRFERAAKRLSGLRHPNVLATGALEHAEDDSLFFAMEYVDGPSLRELLNFAPAKFDPGLALAIARCVAEGLGAAHATGMIHLDLKPENILVAGETTTLVPKIANFGIGATRENGNTFLAAGRILLTPTYAAPEQWRDTRSEELDGRTDLYALGGILFEMLTGETVFDAFGYHVWARQHLTVPPRKPSRLRPELAAWRGLDDLVRTLLAKSPDSRPKDAAAALALLDKVQFGAETIEVPPVRIVAPHKPVAYLRVQEAPPDAIPAIGSEAAVETTSAFSASLTEPVAEDEAANTEEAPVSFSPAFADELETVESAVEFAPAEPPYSEPAPFTADVADDEHAAVPVPAHEIVPPEFPVEWSAPATEAAVAPSELETENSAPEPEEESVVAEEPAYLADSEFRPEKPEFIQPAEAEPIPIAEAEPPTIFSAPEGVEEHEAQESVEEQVAAESPQHISDPEAQSEEPEFIPPAEVEPTPVAEAEPPTVFSAPEAVEEHVAQESVEEQVAAESPQHISDPEAQSEEPEFIPLAEVEPTPVAEAEHDIAFLDPELLEQAAEPESAEEKVAAMEQPAAPLPEEEPFDIQEFSRLSDSEFPPPEPEFIPTAEAELQSTFTPSEALEEPHAPEAVEQPFAPVSADEPFDIQKFARLADSEFPPAEPEFIPTAEADPTPIADYELHTASIEQIEPESTEEVHTPEAAEEPVEVNAAAHIADPEFPPPQPEFIPTAEAEPTPIAEYELHAASIEQIEPESVEEAHTPEPAEEPAEVHAAAHIADPEFLPPQPEFIEAAEAEQVQIAEPEILTAFSTPESATESIAPETAEQPLVAEEHPHFSATDIPSLEPEFRSLADTQPIHIVEPEPPTTFSAPEKVEEPDFAPNLSNFSDPELPQAVPEFVPWVKPKRAPLSPEVLAALNSPEPLDEHVFVPEPAHLADPEFAPFKPEFLPPAKPEPSPIAQHEPPPSFARPDPHKEPVITSARTRFFDREFSSPVPEFLPPSTPEAEPFLPPHFSSFTAPKTVEPVIAPPRRSFATEFLSDMPGPPSSHRPPMQDDPPAEESVMDVEELKRLFGRGENGVKADDGLRRTTSTTSMFGPNSTGLGREEWPATAAPTNFFGKPYKPAGPEAQPAQIPEFNAAFSRPNISDWIDTGTTAEPSEPEEEVEEVETVQRVSHFPGTTFLQEIDYQEEAEEEEPEEERHLGRTILIVVLAVLLLAAVGFAIWKLVLNDANEPVTKMNAACAQGDGKACYDLGAFYEQTNTVSNGDERATALYSQACELNFPLACRKLGLKYLLGTGIARDNPKAIQLFTKGCDKADAESCDNLANIYHEGKDVPADDAKAAVFYQKACATGDEFGCKWANQLATPTPATRPLPKRVTPPAAPHKAK